MHDWFTAIGGAERVLLTMHQAFPEAPIYLLRANAKLLRTWLPNATIIQSSLSNIPIPKRFERLLVPFMPSAIESFDFSGYDTVISSCVHFAKGIVVRPGTKHISYCYSPSRPLWDRTHANEYRGFFSTLIRHVMRLWDSAAAQRPDVLIAPSVTVLQRIQKWYRRDALVLEPPTTLGTPSCIHQPFFLLVGRCTHHKNIDPVLDAFAKLSDRLVVIGTGPLLKALRRRASPNVELLGWVSDDTLREYYERCTAVLIASEEDWGLTAVEALSYGKPVVALRAGGVTEIVEEGVTGEFFDDAIPEAIAEGVKRVRILARTASAATLAHSVQRYTAETFIQRLRHLVATT